MMMMMMMMMTRYFTGISQKKVNVKLFFLLSLLDTLVCELVYIFRRRAGYSLHCTEALEKLMDSELLQGGRLVEVL